VDRSAVPIHCRRRTAKRQDGCVGCASDDRLRFPTLRADEAGACKFYPIADEPKGYLGVSTPITRYGLRCPRLRLRMTAIAIVTNATTRVRFMGGLWLAATRSAEIPRNRQEHNDEDRDHGACLHTRIGL
jgi:hypothetical protein